MAAVEEIAKHRLYARYQKYRDRRAFAADGLLNELCRLAWATVRTEEGGDEKAIASNLAHIFGDAAARMEGIPILVEPAEKWFREMDPPLMRALDRLTGRSTEGAAAIIGDPSAVYARVAAEISN